jgi:hypothetical protein
MSKFFLNLLVQISKAFVFLKIQILFENHFSSDSGPSGPAPSSPAASPAGSRAQSDNGVSSHVAAKWAPPVRSSPFLAPTDSKHVSTTPRRN